MWDYSTNHIRLLPYPDGKTFAFTVIDDTDASTLENVRPVYEYLWAIGLRTTKTAWMMKPCVQDWFSGGDTLERPDYAAYLQLLKSRGFEIALHNVSGASNTRDRVEAGLERFKEFFGNYPRINVHHEKNRENLHFVFAQSGCHLPPAFRTAAFRRLHALARANGSSAPISDFGCSGEDSRSGYFWGDLCRCHIQYVRSNVFFRDLDTLRANPMTPYHSAETPWVNHWFDSSDGADAVRFNAILRYHNIGRLRREHGCAILYTHFGKGFASGRNGAPELNAETRARLSAVAAHPDGWFVPVSAILDRLLAFQKVAVARLSPGFAIVNENAFDVSSVTLLAWPGARFIDSSGTRVAADGDGRIVLPQLRAQSVIALLPPDAAFRPRPWHETPGNPWLLDLGEALRKLRSRASGDA